MSQQEKEKFLSALQPPIPIDDEEENDFILRNDAYTEVKSFKYSMIECIIQRFTGSTELVGPQRRKIFTFDVFHNEKYILATLLDPRIKQFAFSGKFVTIIPPREGE